jgi:hypothetical protein
MNEFGFTGKLLLSNKRIELKLQQGTEVELPTALEIKNIPENTLLWTTDTNKLLWLSHDKQLYNLNFSKYE